MDYEIVKKLKDAGYIQNGRDGLRYFSGVDEPIYVPSLSELIEACGDKFESLTRVEWEEAEDTLHWTAYPTEESYKGDCMIDCCGYTAGDTPEEAVAKLWLELNKKDE